MSEPFGGFTSWEDDLAEARAADRAEVARLRAAIEHVLADCESQHPGGWGPDVTTVAYLQAALDG